MGKKGAETGETLRYGMCMYAFMYICMYVCMCVHGNKVCFSGATLRNGMCMYACLYVCACMYVCVCTYIACAIFVELEFGKRGADNGENVFCHKVSFMHTHV